MKTQSRNNLPEMKVKRTEEKVMPLPKEQEKEFFRKFEKTDIVKNKDGVYELLWNRNHVSKGGSTPDPGDDRWILRRTQTLTFFLLASPNLEDEIHFKGGRFVTSQNSKFWNVIINR